MSRTELLDLSRDLAGLRRAVDVALAHVAGELIAHTTGGSVADARRLVAVGDLMTGSMLTDGVAPGGVAPNGAAAAAGP